MKFYYVLFLFANLFFINISLTASENNYFDSSVEKAESPLSFRWQEDKENIYLYMDLSKELKMPDDYQTGKKENSCICIVVFEPNPIFVSSPNQAIELSVILDNTNNPMELKYEIAITTFHKQNKNNEYATVRKVTTETGTLCTSAIDMQQDPFFFDYGNDSSHACICFKKLLSDSEIN